MVRQKSGISRGSLYHHFQDISELLELAMVESFALSVDQSITVLTAILHSAKNRDEMLKGLFLVTEQTQPRSLSKRRIQRARLISFTEDNPRLKASLAVEQQRLTDAITDLIREAQERGWMSRNVDPRCAAVLIQAYTLGKIVDDVVTPQMSEAGWNGLINQIIEKVLAAKE